jgi:hypothetical protein
VVVIGTRAELIETPRPKPGRLLPGRRYRHRDVTVVLALRIDPSASSVVPSKVMVPMADCRSPLSVNVKVQVPSRSVNRLRKVDVCPVPSSSADAVIVLH